MLLHETQLAECYWCLYVKQVFITDLLSSRRPGALRNTLGQRSNCHNETKGCGLGAHSPERYVDRKIRNKKDEDRV